MEPRQQAIEHTDATATQGFERSGDNTITVFPGDCVHCLTPYLGRGGVVKVWTNNGIEYWCTECATEGIERGTCIKFRSLDKKQRKELKKYARQQDRSFE